jgi:hypothetical protein
MTGLRGEYNCKIRFKMLNTMSEVSFDEGCSNLQYYSSYKYRTGGTGRWNR